MNASNSLYRADMPSVGSSLGGGASERRASELKSSFILRGPSRVQRLGGAGPPRSGGGSNGVRSRREFEFPGVQRLLQELVEHARHGRDLLGHVGDRDGGADLLGLGDR